MRPTLLVVLALAGTARADEDGPFVAVPRLTAALAVQGHVTWVGDRGEHGWGPALEVAVGRQRWQYFAHAGVAASELEVPGAGDAHVRGHMIRGGLGARWLARQFGLVDVGVIELHLAASAGVERMAWNDGGRLIRPELTVGWQLALRAFRLHGLAYRMNASVLFTPSGSAPMPVACRGSCSQAAPGAGFLVDFGFAW